MRGICVFLTLKGKARGNTVVVLADNKPEPPFKSYWIIDLGHGASSVVQHQCDSNVIALTRELSIPSLACCWLGGGGRDAIEPAQRVELVKDRLGFTPVFLVLRN